MSLCRVLILAGASLTLVACATLSAPLPMISPTLTPLPPAIPTALPTGEPESPTQEGASAPAALSADPFVPMLSQLTQPGCCVQPFWSADGSMVLFIDQPQPTALTGIYGVPITGGEPVLVSERIGLPSRDGRYRAYLSEEGETVVEATEDEERWVIPNEGLRVFFSPGSMRLAWSVTPQTGGNFDQQPSTINISNLDGSDVEELITVYGGGIAGWLDDDRLLLVGRQRGGSQDVSLFSLSVVDGTRVDLITNQRIRSVQIAPGGEWVTYSILLHPEDTGNDGLWVIKADGSQRYKLEVFGAANWRDSTHLLLIPFEADAPSHRLWQFDATTGEATPLTDPAVTPFKVSQGDWSVSPTGDHVVFLSAADESLWLIDLPPIDE